jgi:hypothetical protein
VCVCVCVRVGVRVGYSSSSGMKSIWGVCLCGSTIITKRPIPAGVVASSETPLRMSGGKAPMHGAAGRSEEVQTDDRSGLPDGQEPPAQEQYCRACADEQDNDTERATHRCTECGPMCKVDFKNNLKWHVV